MEKEKNKALAGIVGNIQDISKALDLLAEYGVFAYTYLLISEKSFNPQTSKSLNIERPDEFLKGVHAALMILGDLPDMLAEVSRKK